MKISEKITHQKALAELYRVFQILNEHFFSGEIKKTIISINLNDRPKNALNLCKARSNKMHIVDDKSEGFSYELEIHAVLFNYLTPQMLQSMMHEMVHLYNLQHDIKDYAPTRKTYHNKNFQATAIKHGLSVEQHSSMYGWFNTKLSESAEKFISTVDVNMDILKSVLINIKPEKDHSGSKKGNSYKYQCPECSLSVRATKQTVNIVCGDCDVQMISEKAIINTMAHQKQSNIKKSTDDLPPI